MSRGTHEIIRDIRRQARRRDPRSPVRCWMLRRSQDADPSSFFHELADALTAEGRKVLTFSLPRSSLDAGEHLLGQLCQAFDVGRLPRASFSAGHPLHKRIDWIARPLALEKSAPFLLLDIPQDWLVHVWDPRRTLPDTPKSILEALLKKTGFDAVVVSGTSPGWLRRLVHGGEGAPGPEGELPARAAPPDLLLDERRWGAAGDEARRLARTLGITAAGMPPLDLELGVACCALGRKVDEIAAVLQGQQPSRPLREILRFELKQRPSWHPALRRLTLPRFAVPRALLDELCGPMEDAQRALVDCLTRAENGQARASAALWLLVDEHHGDPEAHARLSEHYRALDGARTPEEAIHTGRVIPWLERLHHGVHQGPAGLAALEEITPLSRMSRYELAWSLSAEFKAYELAAGIYRQLAEENPGDAYSHHYWAWNLDQAGKEMKVVWREYKAALAIEPDNPWYNSRYITFLRDNGFQRDAREAWREAHPIVGSSAWSKMPTLPEQFHRWIARAALDAGDLVLAREVLESLPPSEIEQRPKLSALWHELEHLSEIDRLGEPIYPISVAMQRRWRDRILVPAEIDGGGEHPARLRAFYPGRVLGVEDDAVMLLLADPAQEPPALSTTELPRAQMMDCSAGQEPEAGRFLELGVYEGDRMVIRYHPREANLVDRRSFNHSLRYLRDDAPESRP